MLDRRPAEVFPPGEYLLDELNARGWTQTEFAEIISRPVRLVNEIINGKRGVTPETATEFGAALGTSAELWMNLDSAYSLWKLGDTNTDEIIHRATMRKAYPIRDMTLRGWIQSSESTQIILNQLFRFFEINSLDERPKLATAAVLRRSNTLSEDLNSVQIAWLYRVKHIANSMQVTNYSENILREALVDLNAYRENPDEIYLIPKLLEKCGIRFVIVETLPSSKIDGVTFWLNSYSPVIGMSLRFDRIDNFWFVLRHEIEHVLNGNGIDTIIVDSDLDITCINTESQTIEEKIANNAAAEFCISQKDLDDFIIKTAPHISRVKLLEFAGAYKVHPGLVVGQLQKRLKRYDLFRPMLISVKSMITSTAITDGFGQILQVEI
jgi:HTH-type transcriptional regulator/antitoxin HigA